MVRRCQTIGNVRWVPSGEDAQTKNKWRRNIKGSWIIYVHQENVVKTVCKHMCIHACVFRLMVLASGNVLSSKQADAKVSTHGPLLCFTVGFAAVVHET